MKTGAGWAHQLSKVTCDIILYVVGFLIMRLLEKSEDTTPCR